MNKIEKLQHYTVTEGRIVLNIDLWFPVWIILLPPTGGNGKMGVMHKEKLYKSSKIVLESFFFRKKIYATKF